MTALAQICIVIVTVVLLAIALPTARMMTHLLKRATEDLSQVSFSVRASAARVDLLTCETRALVVSLRDCVPAVLRVVGCFEVVGQRTADLSSTLLEEFELPVFTAAAVARGARSGAGHPLKRLMQRFTQRRSPLHHGGMDHE